MRELRRILPDERIIYFGDLARLPYGIKSEAQIRTFSDENTRFLLNYGIKALVVACNSSSSAAYSFLKKTYHELPIIDVIEPAARLAVSATRNGKIGVMATQATVGSGAYEKAIKRQNHSLGVESVACPLLVPLVEEGILKGAILTLTLKRYLVPLLQKKIDTLILGCTHYPLLEDEIQKVAGTKVKLIHSAPQAAFELRERLKASGAIAAKIAKSQRLQVFVSDSPLNFKAIASRFLGESLGRVHMVKFEGQVLKNGGWVK